MKDSKLQQYLRQRTTARVWLGLTVFNFAIFVARLIAPPQSEGRDWRSLLLIWGLVFSFYLYLRAARRADEIEKKATRSLLLHLRDTLRADEIEKMVGAQDQE